MTDLKIHSTNNSHDEQNPGEKITTRQPKKTSENKFIGV